MSKKSSTTQYWLFKSEPDVFSIDDLKRNKTTCWEGVRNYQARNLLRDTIKKGDQVLFYHSNAEPPGIVGRAEVIKDGYPDNFAFDKKEKYYDARSKKESPTWFMVDIKHVETFKKPVTLPDLKSTEGLEDMMVVQKGSRLSIQPVKLAEWEIILKLAARAK